ncbi:hypothetical protein EXIGLDRAFT_193987 [Exidia glandulosa HHB12029]|uniref:DUF6699 domain-containing protein n=1 Tax=Exidia glandulosa HHB12029 TaxID=1314781 RepID=A0A165EW99_EXIGL|nr:hypothetical protein EXIGLDRAFT_193987 [Exidia glandulosa HHB12029]
MTVIPGTPLVTHAPTPRRPQDPAALAAAAAQFATGAALMSMKVPANSPEARALNAGLAMLDPSAAAVAVPDDQPTQDTDTDPAPAEYDEHGLSKLLAGTVALNLSTNRIVVRSATGMTEARIRSTPAMDPSSSPQIQKLVIISPQFPWRVTIESSPDAVIRIEDVWSKLHAESQRPLGESEWNILSQSTRELVLRTCAQRGGGTLLRADYLGEKCVLAGLRRDDEEMRRFTNCSEVPEGVAIFVATFMSEAEALRR